MMTWGLLLQVLVFDISADWPQNEKFCACYIIITLAACTIEHLNLTTLYHFHLILV